MLRGIIFVILVTFPYSVISSVVSHDTKCYELLNKILSFKADFTQINYDNSIQQGFVIMLKPGFLKWNYYPPTHISIVIKKKIITYYDKELKEYTYAPANNPIFDLLSNNVSNIINFNCINVVNYPNTQIATIKDLSTNSIIKVTFNKIPIAITKLSINYPSQQDITIKFDNIITNQFISKKEFHVELN
ncbi:outer membrane lipoprotein carrier protein LolA [Neoehrlichia mikurensis]|uniref:Outer membrane lipoprotein carrier protein LolA n=1 Tax=Neoehrlichia mikurensis TaxID=89586 RepID=A0A9Q9C1F9_9RICK|nr:outer membrane lipoprotein carrier protein LolA [Neoehrlichia mikurensis]QXK91643.1 outer membrane lipoprotein carrier protein LolA [Neoehrlichia mikurensis]QXK92854.1 outer membrane lipoprotein carrier protein LolA [Neoehrlichia mikurensis]QXK93334.1 outer membrane lipoprotein carrier protein LolA [Neoehrlichia mikurensis]UTO55724.1 outer membrane lipoprotein carrier protein LolA [Neoehrlichia mikurensis]UTO56641.1 outer membrane lipoprotein carrier protein LolA [Neoehrlichia mikurensis]